MSSPPKSTLHSLVMSTSSNPTLDADHGEVSSLCVKLTPEAKELVDIYGRYTRVIDEVISHTITTLEGVAKEKNLFSKRNIINQTFIFFEGAVITENNYKSVRALMGEKNLTKLFFQIKKPISERFTNLKTLRSESSDLDKNASDIISHLNELRKTTLTFQELL